MSVSDFYQYQETFDEYIKQSVRTMYAARIESYNSSTRRASVKILDKLQTGYDEYEEVSILTDIPISMPVGGGFFLSFPVSKGDLGRLCIFSQDVDSYKTFGGINITDPNHNFSYSNSIFIPDFNPFNSTFSNHHSSNLVIGSTDSKTTLSITPDKELIVAQDGVQKLKLNTDGTWSLTGDLTVTGNVNITGSLVTTSTTTASDVIIGGKNVNSHVHTDPQGGSTGAF